MGAADEGLAAITRPLLRVTAKAKTGATDPAFHDLNAPSRSARARDGLRLTAAFQALRRDQLEALLLGGAGLKLTSRRVVALGVLADLRERGLAEKVGLPGAGSAARCAYVLTAAGQRMYAAHDASYPRRRATRLSVGLLDHAVMLADIAIAFGAAATNAGDVDLLWESDWEAVVRVGSSLVIPDALVTLERGGWRTRGFVQADRSTEWQHAFAEKVRRYVALYARDQWRATLVVWPLVLTITTSDAHARSLARLAYRVATGEGGSRIARAFRCSSFEALCARGPLSSIWHVGDFGDDVALLDDPADAPGRPEAQR
ncbi:MAG: replication-relaxation family protein [Candidatus Limnocylindria bacterium]